MAADAMRARAAEIREAFSYIGLFEWVAWGVQTKVQILMLFGTGIVNLRQTFAPSMPPHSRSTLRVCAVSIADDGEGWLSAAPDGRGQMPVVNHYVIGVGAVPDVGSATSPAGAEATSHSQCVSAVQHALRVGWLLRPTVTDGDCGIDCMSWHLHLPRDFEIRMGIRSELADFIERVAEDEAWQDVFAACCEMPAASPGALYKGSEPAASSSSASSGLGGPPPPTSLPPASSPPLLPPPPLPPPATEPIKDQAVAAIAVSGPRAFREWLQSQSLVVLNELTKSATAFQQAEARWRKEEFKSNCESGPHRKRADTKVNLKYATAVAYEKWRSGPGKSSKCHLKDLGLVRLSGYSSHLPRPHLFFRTP
jgi:hypothetical protein